MQIQKTAQAFVHVFYPVVHKSQRVVLLKKAVLLFSLQWQHILIILVLLSKGLAPIHALAGCWLLAIKKEIKPLLSNKNF